MQLDDFFVSQEHRFSTGIDPATGACYVQVQISISAVDYEVDHEIPEDVARHPERHLAELLPLVERLRTDEYAAYGERMAEYVRVHGRFRPGG
jgi:hypothetical protein